MISRWNELYLLATIQQIYSIVYQVHAKLLDTFHFQAPTSHISLLNTIE